MAGKFAVDSFRKKDLQTDTLFARRNIMATVRTESSDQFPTLIGQLYARWTLDCLIEIAYAVSIDFINRPSSYKGDIPKEIVNLRMSYGTDANFPNTAQRPVMMMPILGRSDGLKPDVSNAASPFYSARKSFFDACVAVQVRTVDTALSTLEGVARAEILAFRNYLDNLRGTSVEQSAKQITAVSNSAINILTSKGVAAVFGLPPAGQSWPLKSIDSNGANLVDAVGKILPLAPDYKLSFQKFNQLQLAAQAGDRALPLVFTADVTSEEELKNLIEEGYRWWKFLYDFQTS
jgi:hypothetical protein